MKLLNKALVLFLGGVLFLNPLSALALTTSIDLKGPVQISAEGDVVAYIGQNEKRKGEVFITRGGLTLFNYTYKDDLNRIALSEDGKYLAVVGNGVHYISVDELKPLWTWTKDGYNTIAISRDGSAVLAGGYKSTIYLFDQTGYKKKWELGKNESKPTAIALSKNGKVGAVTNGKNVFLINTETNAIKWKVRTSEGATSLQLSEDGKYLLAKGMRTAFFWDTKSSRPLWQKSYKSSLIGGAMSDSGKTIVISSKKGVNVYDTKGKTLQTFEANLGNSDVAVSANGQYFYVNSGDRKLFAFDKRYDEKTLRPFRIVKDINAGGQSKQVATSPFGNIWSYKKGEETTIERVKPSILSTSPGVPVLFKGQPFHFSYFVTNPTTDERKFFVRVVLALPESAEFFTSISKQVPSREPDSIKTKLVDYAIDEIGNQTTVFTSETFSVTPGDQMSDTRIEFVPAIASGVAVKSRIKDLLGKMDPTQVFNIIKKEISKQLSKLVGQTAADASLGIAEKAFSGNYEITPQLAIGTVTLYDADGAFIDQDPFYFIYIE